MVNDRDGSQWLIFRQKADDNRNKINASMCMSKLGFYKRLYDSWGNECIW